MGPIILSAPYEAYTQTSFSHSYLTWVGHLISFQVFPISTISLFNVLLKYLWVFFFQPGGFHFNAAPANLNFSHIPITCPNHFQILFLASSLMLLICPLGDLHIYYSLFPSNLKQHPSSSQRQLWYSQVIMFFHFTNISLFVKIL